MTNSLRIDPALFNPDAQDEETRTLNEGIIAKLSSVPEQWKFPPAVIRQLRREGKGIFPLSPKSPRAENVVIEGPGGQITLRVISPGTPAGVYLHIHGGGFVLGGADEQDARLERIVEEAGLAAVSVDYRLAPENPYPAAPDDCEAAALWLVANCRQRFGTDRLLIGGESAGANLSVATLLRLRDRHGLTPFCGANLVAGIYDQTFTPSARNWSEEKLILSRADMRSFARHYIPDGTDPSDPDLSPLNGRLDGLPPALFTIGTRDPLVDDSLFLAARWAAAGNRADLAVYPGGAHVFIAFPCALAQKANRRIADFLKGCREGRGREQ